DYGADDYIVKPFEIEEIVARLRVSMRRNQSVEVNHDTINIHDIEIDTTAYTVSIEGTPIDLTKTEHELLYLLVKNKGIVMKREQILDRKSTRLNSSHVSISYAVFCLKKKKKKNNKQ